MSTSKPFKLSAQLVGHTGDVRALAVSPDAALLSASRDGTARVWIPQPQAKGATYKSEACISLEPHTGYVNSAAWWRTSDGSVALTGGQDKTINGCLLLDATPGSTRQAPDYTLLGHSSNICTLDTWTGEAGDEESGYIVSGSWDKTARVWKRFSPAFTLVGATASIWAVLAVGAQHVLTASADKLIRLYALPGAVAPDGKEVEVKPVATFKGHADAVRALVALGDGRFGSASNDSNIHVYALPSPLPAFGTAAAAAPIAPLATLSAHTSFVYSLARLPTGDVLSSGEDGSVRVWNGEQVVQTITIPAISVWSVVALPNDDLACASSDGVVRIFSRDSERWADAETLKAYDDTIASQALNKTQVGDVQKDSLPGPEALREPGAKEGAVKMINAGGGAVEAHRWTRGAWVKIGDVVGGVGSGTKKLYEGKEYDYVFDVDIADGVPALKLPHNASDNPFASATRFLEKNGLPNTYVDTVVNFINKNTEGSTIGADTSQYVDPYTGASRYQAAPSGGASRPANTAAPAPGSNPDPFTRTEPVAAKVAPSSVLPHTAPLSFKTLNFGVVKAKLAELNASFAGQASELSAAQLSAITTLLAALEANSTQKMDVAPLEAALSLWPASARLPLLDTYRVAALGSTSSTAAHAIRTALEASRWSEAWPAEQALVKERDTHALLALRTLANLWASEERKKELAEEAETTLALLKGSHSKHLSKNGRVAFASVLLNYSIFVVTSPAPVAWASLLLELVLEVLATESGDAEVVFRTLVALGNLLTSKSASELDVDNVAIAQLSAEDWAARAAADQRIAQLHREIIAKTAGSS